VASPIISSQRVVPKLVWGIGSGVGWRWRCVLTALFPPLACPFPAFIVRPPHPHPQPAPNPAQAPSPSSTTMPVCNTSFRPTHRPAVAGGLPPLRPRKASPPRLSPLIVWWRRRLVLHLLLAAVAGAASSEAAAIGCLPGFFLSNATTGQCTACPTNTPYSLAGSTSTAQW
jgi:hypothetical protein